MKTGTKSPLPPMTMEPWTRGSERTSYVNVKRTLTFLFLFFCIPQGYILLKKLLQLGCNVGESKVEGACEHEVEDVDEFEATKFIS